MHNDCASHPSQLINNIKSPPSSLFCNKNKRDQLLCSHHKSSMSSLLPQTHAGNSEDATQDEPKSPGTKHTNWLLVSLYSALAAVGSISGPLLQRLYFAHGGTSKWLCSLLQSVGFFALGLPIAFLYFKRFSSRKANLNKDFFLEPKLVISSAAIGVMVGLDNFMYSTGLSAIPVSTSTLLFSTQLAFTALFAYVITRRKLTFYSFNAVLVITLGAAVLALHASKDRPVGVTQKRFMVGFLVTLLGAALMGLVYPSAELAYSKSNKKIDILMVLQFQFVLNLFASLFAAVGMLSSNDYKIISKEAKEFGLGESQYCLIVVATAIIWQFSSLGCMGVVSCSSALFTGILNAALLPLTEIGAVVAFHEKFGGEKAMSLVLCLWGFTSYFIGEYRKTRTTEAKVEQDI